MDFKNWFYPESGIGGFSDVDGTIIFFNRVNSLLKPDFVVLDFGCGRAEYKKDPSEYRRNLRIIKGKVKKVIGLDVDSAAKKNPFLNEFHLLKGTQWPIDDKKIDVIICDWVLEHLTNVENFFSESNRVLKKGGYLCIRTPNKWGYVAIGARLIPNKHHSFVTSFVQRKRQRKDVFPTVYSCNSVHELKKVMKKYGFESVVYEYDAEPSYFAFSRIFYFFGVLYHRFAPSILKGTIFAFGKKVN